MVKCASCCLKCIEDVCEYINKAAYCYMAVSGENFCTSAINGFCLNLKHMLSFYWANFLAKVFIFLGKLGVTALNVYSCYMIMKFITEDLEEISSVVGPLFVVGCFTYITVTIFLGMFDEAVMAMLTCLSIDMDLHDGNPKYGPPTFHDATDKMKDSGNWKGQKTAEAARGAKAMIGNNYGTVVINPNSLN